MPVSPLAFGAVGDGVTDDTAAVKSAIAAAPCVLFDQGKQFRVTAALIPQNNQTWLGPGTLVWDASTLTNLVSHTDGITFVTLSGVRFDGVQWRNTAQGSAAFGVNIGASDHVPTAITITACHFDHCGANITGGDNHRIIDNFVHDIHADRAIGCTTSIPGTNFDNHNSLVLLNTVVNADHIGIYGGGMLSGGVFANSLVGVGLAGDSFGIDMNAARDTPVQSNLVQSPFGILFEQSSGTGGAVTVDSNVIVGNDNATGVGVQVWPNGGAGQYASVSVTNCALFDYNTGIFLHSEPPLSQSGNTFTRVRTQVVQN